MFNHSILRKFLRLCGEERFEGVLDLPCGEYPKKKHPKKECYNMIGF